MKELRFDNPQLFREAAFVGGKWIKSSDTLEVTAPYDGSLVGSVPLLSEKEINSAIDEAEKAFQSFGETMIDERASLLERWFGLIMAHQEDLALILAAEQGRPITEARGEVAYAASFVKWFAEQARRTYGVSMPRYRADAQSLLIRQPVGVSAMITPWNFPAAMITRKAAPAIAAGCTCVIKPAMETPFTALGLGALAELAGFPAGVINIITGKSSLIGDIVTSSEKIRKLSFTGSTEVGRLLMKKSADNIKKLSLELGGNAPIIIFNDADLEIAVKGTLASKFRNCGQTCVCANRIYVQSELYESFVKALIKGAEALKVGDNMDPKTQVGPLINDQALSKIEEIVKDALDKGAKLHTGGKKLSKLGERYYAPTVISEVSKGMKIVDEEIFGPVAAVQKFKDEEEVLSKANDTIHGLASYFFTKDISRTFRVSRKLQYGMVAINEGIMSSCYTNFGGVKQSGIGREGGVEGIDEYLESKYILFGGLTP